MSWRLGVVGTPIAHSLTPAMHDAALAALGLEGTSRIFDVGRDDEPSLDAMLGEVDAVSVTMPLKDVMRGRCDEVDDTADRVRAVNTVCWRDGRLLGRSTDGVGFLDAVRADFGLEVAGRTVVVLGAGGAARSIVDACAHAGAAVVVRARRADAAAALADRYDRVIANPPQVLGVDLVVCAVPGGADLSLPDCHVTLAPHAVAVDIAYRPARSAWLDEQERAGARTANGLAMLAHQAQHQLEWWFGRPVPIAPLRAAVGL